MGRGVGKQLEGKVVKIYLGLEDWAYTQGEPYLSTDVKH